MTKKYDFIRCVIFLFLVLGPLTHAHAAGASSSSGSWTIGAEKFRFTQQTVSDADNSGAEVMPKLILEQLAQNLERVPSAREQLDRTLYDLQKARIDLFLQLSKESQTRDALVLTAVSEKELQSGIKEEDGKIADIRKKLRDNLDQAAKAEQDAAEKIRQDEERKTQIAQGKVIDEGDIPDEEKDDKQRFRDILKDFVPGREEHRRDEKIALYKNDFTQLFTPDSSLADASYTDRGYENAVVSAGINGLITGTMTLYGGYAEVSVSLIIYPGARTAATVTEVGAVSDMRHLAVNIARRITPEITNNMPVELVFTVQPEEAASHVVITVDDVVYKEIPEHLIVDSGVHSVMFSAPGYKKAGMSYGFRGRRRFAVDVTLVPDNPAELTLILKKPFAADVYGNGLKYGSVDGDSDSVKIDVNSEPVLGQFITEDGSAAPFYISYQLLKDGTVLAVNTKPFDRSEYIDTRRKWMYGSYSLLIVSLMGTIYTYGNLHSETVAYKNGYISYEEAKGWQQAAQVCAYISIGCGAAFVYELVRYFIAADSVLPPSAKKTKLKPHVPEAPPGAEPVQETVPDKQNGEKQ